MSSIAGILRAVVASIAVSVTAFGGPVVFDPTTWDSGTVEGWKETGDAAISNPGTYLRVSFGAQEGPPMPESDTFYTDQATDTGNFQANPRYWVTFQFMAQSYLPLSSVVAFHNPVSGRTWEHAFTPTTVGSWQTYNVLFDWSGGWLGPGNAADFWSDLASVDWVGITIQRAMNTFAQNYGLDNWSYYQIPEPGSMALLASVCISLAAIRKRLRAQPTHIA